MTSVRESVGRYRIDKVLGQGAMGVVYRAHDPEIDRVVAIKLVRAELLGGENGAAYLARFRQEVQAAARCTHANVAAIFDFGTENGDPFFVMEYVEGVCMDRLAAPGVGLGADAAVLIVGQVLDALDCAHGLGVVHRDIKPANILVTRDWRAKVMDFGISRLASSGLTREGSVMGTPNYMSPEQLRGETVDARSDIFSVGALLHEALVGRPPFQGATFEEAAVKLLFSDDLGVDAEDERLPPPLREVVLRALAKSPDQRYPSARAMGEALKQAAPGVGSPSIARTMIRIDGAVEASRPSSPTAKSLPGAVADRARTDRAKTSRPQTGVGDVNVLSGLERRLAQDLGPIAGRLVRAAARDTDSLPTLYTELAANIQQPAERERFLKDVRTRFGQGPPVVETTAGTLGATPAPTAPHEPALPTLAAADVERLRQHLTRYLGPMAGVLVKRLAPSASTSGELRAKLAEHLDAPDIRAQFLTETGGLA